MKCRLIAGGADNPIPVPLPPIAIAVEEDVEADVANGGLVVAMTGQENSWARERRVWTRWL